MLLPISDPETDGARDAGPDVLCGGVIRTGTPVTGEPAVPRTRRARGVLRGDEVEGEGGIGAGLTGAWLHEGGEEDIDGARRSGTRST